MSETITSAKCRRCGVVVGVEDGQRQTLCDCDPFCRICGQQFIPLSALAREEGLCRRCEERRDELLMERSHMKHIETVEDIEELMLAEENQATIGRRKTMKIVRLEAENVKRLEAVFIEPNGNVVEIAGDNAQGKTSVLDSIIYALGGERSFPGKPIREGAGHAKVELSLGGNGKIEYKIIRTMVRDSGSKLRVLAASGEEQRSPQRLLESWLGRYTFDPLAFMRLTPKEQRDTLLSIAGLQENLLEIEEKRVKAFDERRELKRDAANLTAQIEGMSLIPEAPKDMPKEGYDLEELEASWRSAAEQSRVREALKSRAISLRGQIEALTQELSETEAELENTPETDYEARFDEWQKAQEANANIKQVQIRRKLQERLDDATGAIENRNGELLDCDLKKEDALKNAILPVEGLSINWEAGVEYKGIPIEQIAESEKLRLSVLIGMASNPKLRVMRIEEGSLLDKNNMRMLGELAVENDYQLWVERVDPSQPSAIIIEEGRVKGSIETTVGPVLLTEPEGGEAA